MSVIGIFPAPLQPSDWGRQGNGHMREVVGALELRGDLVAPLAPSDLVNFAGRAGQSAILHVNWTEALTLHFIAGMNRPQRWAARLPLLAERFAENAFGRLMAPIRAGGVPVIYQVHDLESNWLPQTPVVRRVDQAIKRALLQSADAWVVHESSALAPIEDFSGLRPRLFARCQLGNYAKFHGAPVPRDQARARLGIPLGGCVFLWSGYCNERRDPRHVLRAFQRVAGPGARLLISGMNAGEFLAGSSHGDRVHIFDRLITNETYRDLVCASDWIVMDADKHLTSAVVRTALSYHRPVLCRPFGSQRDMAQDAAIWLDGLSPDRALERAQAMPAAEYERMTAAASARDSERTWARYHEAYGDLLGQLNAAAPGRRPYFSAHP